MKRLILVALAALLFSGCATVQPWERGNLARQEMNWQSNAMSARFDAHVYTAREASFGGGRTSGGGCGCN